MSRTSFAHRSTRLTRGRGATVVASLFTGVALAGILTLAPAGAQTPTTPTTLAPSVTTLAPSVTTLNGSATVVTAVTTVPGAAVTTTTTVVPDTTPQPLIATNDSGSSTPWIAIALIVVGVAVLVGILIFALRRKGSGDTARTDWRERAAAATAEAGATVRQVSTGAAVTGPVVAQLVTSIRTYGELAAEAPDASLRSSVERARRAIQSLGQRIDADHQLRRAQPPADPATLSISADSVRDAASDTDKVLRSVYRELNEPE